MFRRKKKEEFRKVGTAEVIEQTGDPEIIEQPVIEQPIIKQPVIAEQKVAPEPQYKPLPQQVPVQPQTNIQQPTNVAPVEDNIRYIEVPVNLASEENQQLWLYENNRMLKKLLQKVEDEF